MIEDVGPGPWQPYRRFEYEGGAPFVIEHVSGLLYRDCLGRVVSFTYWGAVRKARKLNRLDARAGA